MKVKPLNRMYQDGKRNTKKRRNGKERKRAFASPGVLVGTMTILPSGGGGGGGAISVGGTASMTNKIELLAPWIALAALILPSIGIAASRRFRKKFEK